MIWAYNVYTHTHTHTHTKVHQGAECGHVALPYNLIQTKKLSHIELFVNQDCI